MAKIRVGVENFVNAEDLVQAIEIMDKQLFSKTCPLLVKIHGQSNDGRTVGEFTGFLYCSSADIIVTAGHIVGFSGIPPGSGPAVESFRAVYKDNFEEDVVLLNHAPNDVPDIAILRGTRRAPRSLVGAGWSQGETVYALGFSPHFCTPSVSKGIVSCGTVGSVAITAYADNGYSGGPVFNSRGQLMGVIKGSIGATILQVGITPAADVHTFLLQSRQPGLLR